MSAPSSNSLELPGLDGTNPLGFLAALGTLVVARNAGESAACLRWARARTWTPVLDGLTTNSMSDLCKLLAQELKGKAVDADADNAREVAQQAYDRAMTDLKKEEDRVKKEKISKKEDRDRALKERVPPLKENAAAKRQEWLKALKSAVQRPELALGKRIDCTAAEYRNHATEFSTDGDSAAREAIEYLAAFGSDACVEDGKGDVAKRRIEATPFCFIRGSGNQNFLDTVRKLIISVTPDRILKALCEPWLYTDDGLSMRWDPVEDKRYALTDVKPADEGARTVWMANLLAYRSLALFPCAPTRRGLGTTAWAVVEEHQVFTWPLWEFAAAPDTVRTMLQLRELREPRLDSAELKRRGITAAFRARRIRFPPKGPSYKLNFSPARQAM